MGNTHCQYCGLRLDPLCQRGHLTEDCVARLRLQLTQTYDENGFWIDRERVRGYLLIQEQALQAARDILAGLDDDDTHEEPQNSPQ